MHYKGGNWSWGRGLEMPFINGDTIENANLFQKEPHTAICEGLTGLTFINCNLTNCDVPDDAVVERCNNRHFSLCSNLHPTLNPDVPCAENCSHVVDTDTIEVDGEVVQAIYYYENTEVV